MVDGLWIMDYELWIMDYELNIREAGLVDIPAIRAIAEVAFRDTYREILSPGQMEYMMEWMYSEESLKKQMTEEGNRFFIIDDVGYVSFRPDGMTEEGVDRFHLEKLYVLPTCQGAGIGRKLFDKVVMEVKALSGGNAALELNVNRYNKALQFYEHIGMYRAQCGDFPIGNGYYMNDYVMRIDLVE